MTCCYAILMHLKPFCIPQLSGAIHGNYLMHQLHAYVSNMTANVHGILGMLIRDFTPTGYLFRYAMYSPNVYLDLTTVPSARSMYVRCV